MNASAQCLVEPKVSGLDLINFAETYLSLVDGEKGVLLLRGHSIEKLVGRLTFAQGLHLLWLGSFASEADAQKVEQGLGQKRIEVFPKLAALPTVPNEAMDFLRLALSSISMEGSDAFEQCLQLSAAMAVATAIWARRQEGLQPIAPEAHLSQGADLLRMIHGQSPLPAQVAALDAYLLTVMDHGMNASTFAARVVASTGSDLGSAIVAGIGALKGPLHGGAPGPVLDMLDAIGQPGNAEAWLEAELKAGRRIMGMGHRIYRVRDPRAIVLEQAIARLQEAGIHSSKLALARAVEAAADKILQNRYPDRPLKANVEFYTAVLLDAIGLKPNLFSACFAVGRVVGWCAHVEEQRKYGRLVRPQSTYIGPLRAD